MLHNFLEDGNLSTVRGQKKQVLHIFWRMAIFTLLHLLFVVSAGKTSEEGSGETLLSDIQGSGEEEAGDLVSGALKSSEGDELISRQRNLNRIFDLLSEIDPESLFEDHNYQVYNESTDESSDFGDNDIESNSVEWKNASSEFEVGDLKAKENVTGPRQERGKKQSRVRVENDVQSFFSLFPINEHVISNIVHNLTRAFQRDILGQKLEPETVTEKASSVEIVKSTDLDGTPDKLETHAPLIKHETTSERGDDEIFEQSTSTEGSTSQEQENSDTSASLQTETTEIFPTPTDSAANEDTIIGTTTEYVTESEEVSGEDKKQITNDEKDFEGSANLSSEDIMTTTEGFHVEEVFYQEEHKLPFDRPSCQCTCDSSLRYMLPEGRNLQEDEITIVLQDENVLCSEEDSVLCCTDIMIQSLPEEPFSEENQPKLPEEPLSKENKPQPRFKFPCQRGWTGPDCQQKEQEEETSYDEAQENGDYADVPLDGGPDLFEEENGNPGVRNDTVVDVDISESVLVDTDGIPQVCLPFLTETTTQSPTITTTQPSLPTVNDKVIFGTMALDEVQMERGLNETVEAKGSWLITVSLTKTSRVKLRIASRTPISCLARRGAPPSLLHFDILASIDGTSRDPLFWNLSPGTWYIQLHNEENFDQEVVLSMSRENADGSQACCRDGCQLIGGRLQCPGEECLHGEERGSVCICEQGWLGPLCNLTSMECRENFCGGRGECLQQTGPQGFETIACDCDPGATGEECQEEEERESEKEEDCSCGEQGVCRAGVCR